MAPLKVLGRVSLRGKGARNGELSGEAASVRQPDRVDEQISTLLQGLEAELRETELPRRASRPPNSKPTSPRPALHGQPTKSTIDRQPPAPARARRRALVKGQGLDRPRGHTRTRRGLLGDPVVRDRFVDIVAGVMVGIVAAFVVIQLLNAMALR
jgi:hypothetical protein